MPYSKRELLPLLNGLHLGSSVAEFDDVLEASRVETSVFVDLMRDRVDLIPGTKGSGKTALFRMIVEFLPEVLLRQRRVVVAHGVSARGDSVFQVYSNEFEQLSEDDFIDFWCIYLAALANEQFIKNDKFSELLKDSSDRVKTFRQACVGARIPDFTRRLTLKDVLGWVLAALKRIRPALTYSIKEETVQLSLLGEGAAEGGQPAVASEDAPPILPKRIAAVKEALEDLLGSLDISLWLMIDRLDEVFLRRSEVETRALRGLLRTLQLFQSPHVRVKIFLRDDILDQITSGAQGFTALTHVTARQADKLSWSEDQILTLIVRRLFSSSGLREFLHVDEERLEASREYQQDCFYRVFPQQVHRRENQSTTLRWIYNRTMDGRGVVTPRDVIELVTRAQQWQRDQYRADAVGETTEIITPSALQYGLRELSKRKVETVLKAEFPHFWPSIEKFSGGKTEYGTEALRLLLGSKSDKIVAGLEAIGFIREVRRSGHTVYQIPYLFRHGLDLTQGRATTR